MAQPRHDEWSKLMLTLQELRHNQADEESERLGLAASGPPSLTSLTSLASNPLRYHTSPTPALGLTLHMCADCIKTLSILCTTSVYEPRTCILSP